MTALRRCARSAAVRASLLGALLPGASLAAPAAAPPPAPPHVVAAARDSAALVSYDGFVEAVRQTVVAAQVSGTLVALYVKAGDRVSTGQTLARVDARAAEQSAAAAQAQVGAARAALEVAERDLPRQRQLFQKRYISEAALDRAEATLKSSRAQLDAQLAQARAARTETDFFVVRAPYAGIVSDVPVALGDMAMPGRALLTIYDPATLRIAASVPQTAIPAALTAPAARIEIPAALDRKSLWFDPVRVAVLPTIDPTSHTVVVRLDLPGDTGLKPGAFARAWLPAATGTGRSHVLLPVSAVVRRTEMTGVYVLDAQNRPLLRQVRLGRTSGERIEILSGISPGERVVTEPQAVLRAAGNR